MRLKQLSLLFFVFLVFIGTSGAAKALAIPGLADTGQGAAGILDPNYTLPVSPAGTAGPIIIDPAKDCFPWVPPAPGSAWIGVNDDDARNFPPFAPSDPGVNDPEGGVYRFRLSIDLTGFDPASVMITGDWAADNLGLIEVNGGPTREASPGFTFLTPFTLDSSNSTFVPGVNTIDFVVTNGGSKLSDGNPVGLLVQNIQGTADVVTSVDIDIRPGSFPNNINPNSNALIPVAILTTDAFNVTTVDTNTVRFGATGTEATSLRFSLEDVNRDGRPDLLLQFRTKDTGIACGDTSASLTGQTLPTFGGQEIEGTDAITTVGCR